MSSVVMSSNRWHSIDSSATELSLIWDIVLCRYVTIIFNFSSVRTATVTERVKYSRPAVITSEELNCYRRHHHLVTPCIGKCIRLPHARGRHIRPHWQPNHVQWTDAHIMLQQTNIPLFHSDPSHWGLESGPQLIHGSLDPHNSAPKQAQNQFSRSCTVSSEHFNYWWPIVIPTLFIIIIARWWKIAHSKLLPWKLSRIPYFL